LKEEKFDLRPSKVNSRRKESDLLFVDGAANARSSLAAPLVLLHLTLDLTGTTLKNK